MPFGAEFKQAQACTDACTHANKHKLKKTKMPIHGNMYTP